MTDPTRSERQELIDADDGDPETTVYARGSGRDTYHRSQTCHHIHDSEGYAEMTRAQAQSRILKPCRECIKAINTDRNADPTGPRLANAIHTATSDAKADGDDPDEAALRVIREHNRDF